MSRSRLVEPTLGLTVALLLLSGGQAQSAFIDATPAIRAGPPDGIPGVTIEPLAVARPVEAPGQELTLIRVTLEPGAMLPPHGHPGTLVLSVESGTLGATIMAGTAELTRAGTAAAEVIGPGPEILLGPGDSVSEPGTIHDARNPGDTPTVLVVAALTAAGQPMLRPIAATPMPGEPASREGF